MEKSEGAKRAQLEIESLPPVVVFLVHECRGYRPRTAWGAFDALPLKALHDIYFSEQAESKVLYAFTAEPPHAADVVAVSVPLQLALEAAFFHVAQIDELVLNPRHTALCLGLPGAAVPQQDVEFSIPADFDPMARVLREELPGYIGALTSGEAGSKASSDTLRRAARALQAGAYFECFHLAHTARVGDPELREAWFYELFALSFFGDPERALELYEQYPERGSADPLAQLLAARYRLLLKQFNEARTILHTLSFHTTVSTTATSLHIGAVASCELARSFLIEKHFARALDAANAALHKDAALSEAYLVRGIAQRGIAYDAGDGEGLREAYADFERVAKQGGYGAAEALYHAGTVCARLGALAEAETAFRQSLFQRDRVSARDALIRILCAQGRGEEAAEELTTLELLVPVYGRQLRSEVGVAMTKATEAPRVSSTSNGARGELWSEDIAQSVAAARRLLQTWEVPLEAAPADCPMLDDLINRFAPDGEFPSEGRFCALNRAGHDTVARALALHSGDILVAHGAAAWGAGHQQQCVVVSSRLNIEIPLEHFVKERVLLGASGDNFSSLESLVTELEVVTPEQVNAAPREWWSVAQPARLDEIKAHVAWTVEALKDLGVELSGGLSDLEVLDVWIESSFEPGGSAKDDSLRRVAAEIDRFMVGLGLVVGQRIASAAPAQWYDHEKPEGISVWNIDLGRIFPVARVQRRVYLASAADFSSKFGSLALSVVVAVVAGKVRGGTVAGHDAVRAALLSALPSLEAFPEAELSGVVNSIKVLSSAS